MPLRVAYATSSVARWACHFMPLHATSSGVKWREVAKSVYAPPACSMKKEALSSNAKWCFWYKKPIIISRCIAVHCSWIEWDEIQCFTKIMITCAALHWTFPQTVSCDMVSFTGSWSIEPHAVVIAVWVLTFFEQQQSLRSPSWHSHRPNEAV